MNISRALKKEIKRGRITRARFWEIIRIFGFHPHGTVATPHGDILIAYTDHENDNPEYPWGYYQTVWAIVSTASKGYIDGFSWLEFDAMHDMHLSQPQRLQARINAAIEAGRDWVAKNKAVGRCA